MDAIGLSAVWLDFPVLAQAATSGRLHAVAGLYLQLLKQERENRRLYPRVETSREMRYRLLRKVEERIIRDDADDLVSILAL